MKKVISVILALSMILCFAACGKEEVPEEPTAYSAGLNEDGFYNLKASDIVTLPQLEGVAIPSDVKVANSSTVQSQIDSLLNSYKTVNQIKDREVKNSDPVNIDYSGSIDGEKFDGGTAKNQSVIAGAQNFIDDFLTQIIGHKPGETFDVNVTFPDPYTNNPALAGKDAVFEVTINYIEEYVLPKLTDEFVATNFKASGFKTVNDLKAYISATVIDNQISDWVGDYLFENTKCDNIPDEVLEHQKACTRANMDDNAAYYGTDVSTLAQIMGYSTVDEMIEANIEDVKDMAVNALMIQAIAEKINLKVSENDITDYFTRMTGSSDYSSSEEHYGLPYLKLMVMNDKVLNYVVENAK